MNLVKATLVDITALQQIGREAYALNFHTHWETGGMEIYLEKEFDTERLKKEITNTAIDWFFINVKNLPIGFVKVKYSTDFENYSPAQVMELVKIYILPRCKGMGYGRFALQEIIKIAQAKEKKMLCLAVLDTNYPSIDFYKRNGFEKQGKTRIEAPLFKEHLRGMDWMVFPLS